MKIKIIYIVIAIIVILVVWYFVSNTLLKDPLAGYTTAQIDKGDVLQEISETGNIKATDDFNLGFRSIGKVVQLNVGVGDVVQRGQILASLDTGNLTAQLESAKSALDYTSSQYETGVNAAQDNLQSSYNSALNVLNNSYTKIYNAYKTVVDLQNSYFTVADQEGIKVWNSREDIQKNMQEIKTLVDSAQSNPEIDSAVLVILAGLDNVYNDLKIIREQCDEGIYYYNVSSTDKTSIDTEKTNINTAITNLTASQTSISAYKIALQKAQDSTVDQAQANIDALQSQINDNYLIAPTNGIITKVNIKRGETVSAGQQAISLLSNNPFQIKAYIYEQDIVNVKIGNDVKIELVAFPKKTFAGKILLIDPAETIIDNVIYYQVTIDFPNQPDGIRSGMTADIVIETNKKEDVLRIPKNVVQIIDGQDVVQFVKNGKIKNQKITTGLEGNDYYEVLSGLQEGDTIVIGQI